MTTEKEDNYTDILFDGKRGQAIESHRCKALGNSMAVPVMRWIGQRIQLADEIMRGCRAR